MAIFCMLLAGIPSVLVAAILDYINIMLPHVNADDPIGFVIMLRSELEVMSCALKRDTA